MRNALIVPSLLTLLAPFPSALRFSDLNPAVGSTYSAGCSEVLTAPLNNCQDGELISTLCSDPKCVRELSRMSHKAQKACKNDKDEDDTFLAMVKAGNVTDLVCPDADSGFAALFKKLGHLRRRDDKDNGLVVDSTPQVLSITTTISSPIASPTFISTAPTPGPPPPPPPERNQKFVFSGFMTFTTPPETTARDLDLVTDSPKPSRTASSSTPSSSSSSKIDLILDDIEPPTAIRNGDSGSSALNLQNKYVIEGASTASSVPLPTGKTAASSSITSSGSKNGASKAENGEVGGDEKEDVEAYSMGSGSARVFVGGAWSVMLSGMVAVVVGLGN